MLDYNVNSGDDDGDDDDDNSLSKKGLTVLTPFVTTNLSSHTPSTASKLCTDTAMWFSTRTLILSR